MTAAEVTDGQPRRITKSDLCAIIGEMGQFRGAVKSEAETTMAVKDNVSIRLTTANDLLARLTTWQAALTTLLEDDRPVELAEVV